MEKKFNYIIEEARKNVLAKNDKEEIKSRLLYFMEENPGTDSNENWLFASFVNIVKSINTKPAFRYVALAVIILLVSGGISVAARSALPGDPLYPVKTGINEKLVALTLFSDQAKAEYDINLAQLRLEEAETTVAQNKLNAQSSQEVIILLSDHLSDIKNRIVNLKNKEDIRVAAEIAVKLQTVLKAHEQIINKLAVIK